MNLRERRCRDCKAKVLAGDSDDNMAFPVAVDDNSLGTLGEAMARLQGRRTYALVRHGKGKRLRSRDRWQIGGGRPLNHADVVAEHRCRDPLPGVPSKLTRPTTEGTTDAPPF